MGYAHYIIERNGEEIEAGYSVEGTCEEADCLQPIDRGLAYLCGNFPGGDEHGCGGYFCDDHMYLSADGEAEQLCTNCLHLLRS